MLSPGEKKRQNFWKKHGDMACFLRENIPGLENMDYEDKIASLAEFFRKENLRIEERVHNDLLLQVFEDFKKGDVKNNILAMGTEIKWNGGRYRTDLCILQKGILENCELQRTTKYNPETRNFGRGGVNLYTKTKNYCVGFSESIACIEKDFEEILKKSSLDLGRVWRSPEYEEKQKNGGYSIDDVMHISSVMIPFGEGRSNCNHTYRLLAELRDVKLNGRKLCDYYSLLYLASPPHYFEVINEEEYPGLTKLLNS